MPLFALIRSNHEMETTMFDGPLQEMMKHAQKVAEQMKEAQTKLSDQEVTGESVQVLWLSP